MQNVRQMTAEELARAVRTLAAGFAAEHHRRQFPGGDEADTWAWAERNWQQFHDQAVEALAVVAADQAAAEAAARN